MGGAIILTLAIAYAKIFEDSSCSSTYYLSILANGNINYLQLFLFLGILQSTAFWWPVFCSLIPHIYRSTFSQRFKGIHLQIPRDFSWNPFLSGTMLHKFEVPLLFWGAISISSTQRDHCALFVLSIPALKHRNSL